MSRPQTRYAAALAVILGQYAFVIGVGLGWFWLAYEGWLGLVRSLTNKNAVCTSVLECGSTAFMIYGVLFGALILLSLRPRIEPFDIQGAPVTPDLQPELFAVIADVTSTVGVPPPDVVYVSLGFELDAVDGGGSWRTGPQRAFVIGLPILHRLTEVEVRTLMTLQAARWLPYQHRIGRLVRRLEHIAGWRVLQENGYVARRLAVWFEWALRPPIRVIRDLERSAQLEQTSRYAHIQTAVDRLSGSLLAFHAVLEGDAALAREQGYRMPLMEGLSLILSNVGEARFRELSSSGFDEAFDAAPAADRPWAFVHPSRTVDDSSTALALDLVRDLPGLERDALAATRDGTDGLRPLAWSDFPRLVLEPVWRKLLEEDTAALRQIRFEALPVGVEAAAKIGRSSRNPFARASDADDVSRRVAQMIAIATAIRLIDLGWTCQAEPGVIAVLTRNGDSACPFDLVKPVVLGNAPDDHWRALCAKAGLTGPLVN